MIEVLDDAGRVLRLAAVPGRIVCLVPSLTETLFALGCGNRVVGVTRYCVEPAADVARCAKVGGTKNPDCDAITALRPDVVIVNAEENRREDFLRLEQQGLTVFVTFPRAVADVAPLVERLGEVTGCRERAAAMGRQLTATLDALRDDPPVRRRVFCPIWKNPWMTIGSGTYVDDMISAAGGENTFRDGDAPYPVVTLDEAAARQPDVVLLPDEPYRFSRRDLADLGPLRETPAARADRVHFVDGKALSWYGPRTAAGLRTLAALLA